jgi:hypothetical protein
MTLFPYTTLFRSLPKEIRDRPVNRTPTQKADAASNAPNDDIPF